MTARAELASQARRMALLRVAMHGRSRGGPRIIGTQKRVWQEAKRSLSAVDYLSRWNVPQEHMSGTRPNLMSLFTSEGEMKQARLRLDEAERGWTIQYHKQPPLLYLTNAFFVYIPSHHTTLP